MRLFLICAIFFTFGIIISKCCAEQCWLIDEYGYIQKFFYEDGGLMVIRKDGHTYLPVLFEHDENCPFCDAMQSGGPL